MAPGVDVFYTESEGLAESEPRSIEEASYECVHPLKVPQYGRDLFRREHDGEALRLSRPHEVERTERLVEDLCVQEEEGRERLRLRARGYVALVGEVVQESGDLWLCHGIRMARSTVAARVEADEALDPLHVGFLGLVAELAEADAPADALEEFWGGRHVREARG